MYMEGSRIQIIDDTTELAPVSQVLRLGGTVIAATDGITLVKGRSGSGKSFFVLNLVRAMLGKGDRLGFDVDEGDYRIGYFSTEMSPHQLKKRYISISEGGSGVRDRFKMVNLLNLPNEEYLDVMINAIGVYGFNVVVIDQMADFVIDINSSVESYDFINTLLGLASTENISIIAIVHQNEGSKDYSKARGHLGSTLEQKSISSLSVSKDSYGNFNVKSTKVRDGVHFSLRYQMMEGNRMVLTSDGGSPDVTGKIEFPITASRLVERIMEITSKSKSHAHKIRNELIMQGKVVTEQNGKNVIYRLNEKIQDVPQ